MCPSLVFLWMSFAKMPDSSRLQDKVVSISIFSGTVRLGLWPHLWCNQCPCPWFDTGHVKQLAAARSHLFHKNLSASKQQVQHLISFNNTWAGGRWQQKGRRRKDNSTRMESLTDVPAHMAATRSLLSPAMSSQKLCASE